MKIFSTADWHYHKDYRTDFWKNALFFKQQAEEEQPDLIIIAGDIADRAVQNTGTAGFDELIRYMQSLLQIAPIYTVYGTPTHDIPGSLEVFSEIRAKHQFTILQPGQVYGQVTDLGEEVLLTGIPEPSKTWLLAEKNLSSQKAAEVTSGVLKNFLTGVANQYGRHNKIPFIVVYHGLIAGARISEKQTLPAGGIELSIRDLQMLHADYYACGHIHKRQGFDGITGGYEGSLYNKTWGELDAKAFSIITFDEDGQVHREARKFPQPPMQKIQVSASEPWDKHIQEGARVWLEIIDTRGNLAGIDTQEIAEKLNGMAAPGSRVTTRVLPEETLRVQEITEKQSLIEKVALWAEYTDLDLPEGTEERCSELEAAVEKEGLSHTRRRMRLDAIELKGAIGVWKGQGKEEITIDFSSYDPGTIALVGDNGAGKSTIIKNCHPFPETFDEAKKLQDAFYLKDSHSITFWTDTVTGIRYKAVKLIDGKHQSGKAEYYLYVKAPDSDSWLPYNDEQTGRKDPYTQAVWEVFGSPELFKRSAYIGQDGAELPATPKGRKELFNALLGNSYLELMSEKAREQVRSLEAQIQKNEGKIEGFRYTLEREGEVADLLCRKEENYTSDQALLKDAQEKLSQLQDALAVSRKRQEKNNSIRRAMKDIEEQKGQTEKRAEQIQQKIAELSRALDHEGEARRTLANEEELQKKISQEQRRKEAHEAEVMKKRTEYFTSQQSYQERLQKAMNTLQAVQREKDQHAQRKESARHRIQAIEREIQLIQDPCPQCGYLPEDVVEQVQQLKQEHAERKKYIAEEQVQEDLLAGKITASKVRIEAVKKEAPKEPHIEPFDASHLERLKQRCLSASRITQLKTVIQKAEQAHGQLKELQDQLEQMKKQLQRQEEQYLDYKRSFDDSIDAETASLQQQVDGQERQVSASRNALTRLQAEIDNLHEEAKRIEEAKKKIASYEAYGKTLQQQASGWELLSRAVGRDGVQALELDALAPSIADVTNTLLEHAYGPRFQVEFKTTREAGTGKQRKQIEDFEIYITDNEEEREELKTQKLSTLSGGERVWIMKALFDAFGVIRERNTGLQYITTFQDESDGALSPEKKHTYLTMVEAAHKQAGRHHTIYITHDAGIQSEIMQSIEL